MNENTNNEIIEVTTDEETSGSERAIGLIFVAGATVIGGAVALGRKLWKKYKTKKDIISDDVVAEQDCEEVPEQEEESEKE